MKKTYATDLSDEEWASLRARLPELPRTVRMRTHALRDDFDAIFLYVLGSMAALKKMMRSSSLLSSPCLFTSGL